LSEGKKRKKMAKEVRSLGFAIKFNGHYLAETSRHRGCQGGRSSVWGDRTQAKLFLNNCAAWEVVYQEKWTDSYYQTLQVVELFEDINE
jgi:hypothetical protein